MLRLLVVAAAILVPLNFAQAKSRFDCTISIQQQCIEQEGDCMTIDKPNLLKIDISRHTVEECKSDCISYDSIFYEGILGNVEFTGINKRKVRILGVLTSVSGELVVVSAASGGIGTVEFGKCHPSD